MHILTIIAIRYGRKDGLALFGEKIRCLLKLQFVLHLFIFLFYVKIAFQIFNGVIFNTSLLVLLKSLKKFINNEKLGSY